MVMPDDPGVIGADYRDLNTVNVEFRDDYSRQFFVELSRKDIEGLLKGFYENSNADIEEVHINVLLIGE